MPQIVQHDRLLQSVGMPAEGPAIDVEQPHSTARMALRVLGLFSETEPVLRVLEIAQRLGIHKSKASRLVAALAAEEFLMRTSNGRYCLGFRIHTVSAAIPHNRALLEAARSELYQLRINTGENAHLSCLMGTEIVQVERVYAEHLMKFFLTHNPKTPIHATSTGKVLLAHAPEALFDKVISQGLPRYTANTITDRETLRNQLISIRACGYAINRDEFNKGLSSVAVPLFGSGGHNAAIAIVAPSDHLNGERLRSTVRLLKQAVTTIVRRASMHNGRNRAEGGSVGMN